MRQLTALVAGAALVVGLLGVLTTAPVAAADRPMPGRFTGYAFDACQAPPQETMDAWLQRSPYWGVGVYIAGASRFCKQQQNLDAAWVATQTRSGWRLLPLTVGRQASCFVSSRPDITRINPDPTDEYAAARAQGRAEAVATLRASTALGIATGSTQWLDIEAFDIGRTHCRRSMLAFVSAWTSRLHNAGYRSGFYSSASSGITALENARRLSPGSYRLPDAVWIGHWNGVANAHTSYLPSEAWRGQRVHQYRGDHVERYGGFAVEIDSNWMEVGGGSRAPKPTPHCGVRVDFPSYAVLARGDKGAQVKALQCLLKKQGAYRGRVHGRYDRPTARAVTRFQRQHPPLRGTGVASKPTWVVLHAVGSTPLAKVGAASNAVRRLQRSLNAAGQARLTVSGVYDKPTARAVRDYQRARGLARTGVVTDAVWDLLQEGRRAPAAPRTTGVSLPRTPVNCCYV